MVIEAGAFIVYRPPRRSLLSVTTELSYLSHSFCRSPRPIAKRKLIAGAVHAMLERRTAATVASTSSDLETGARRLVSHECRVPGPRRWSGSLRLGGHKHDERYAATASPSTSSERRSTTLGGQRGCLICASGSAPPLCDRRRGGVAQPARLHPACASAWPARCRSRTSQSCRALTATALDETRK
jgi:hypothetical protein